MSEIPKYKKFYRQVFKREDADIPKPLWSEDKITFPPCTTGDTEILGAIIGDTIIDLKQSVIIKSGEKLDLGQGLTVTVEQDDE